MAVDRAPDHPFQTLHDLRDGDLLDRGRVGVQRLNLDLEAWVAVDASAPPSTTKTWLTARRDEDRGWVVSRTELERFVASRKPTRTPIRYDETFSCSKCVSILWATATPHDQAELTASIDAAVDAGLRYLESVSEMHQHHLTDEARVTGPERVLRVRSCMAARIDRGVRWGNAVA